jgi:Cdc6-like AAA superfamily ATPase
MTDFFNKAKQNFQSFITEFESLKVPNLSESDTRSKLIDKLLIEVLGWSENDIQREGYVKVGYYDYRLSLPSVNIIVEAKKNFDKFTLPAKGNGTTFNVLFNENEDVINQIRHYLVEVGVDLGIITNGQQFLIGRFINNNGESWRKNTCLFFNGFNDINNNFIEFCNNLSKECVIKNNGFDFLKKTNITFSSTIINSIVDSKKEINRNDISSEIGLLIDDVFGEIYRDGIEDNPEFLKECFVENKEIIKNKADLHGLFEDKNPCLSEVKKAKNMGSISSQIDEELNSTPIIAKELKAPNPIIIIGSKGAGKTTFINFLFKSAVDNKTLEKHPFVYIDFTKYYNQEKIIDTQKIAKDAINELYEKYSELELYSLKALKQIFYKERHFLEKGTWSTIMNDQCKYEEKLTSFLEDKQKDTLDHLQKLSQYLIREHRKRLIIIFDNADQYDDKIQEDLFLFAASLNRNAHCGVFISLREGYYYKWRNKAPFNAYECNVYHITAPSFGDVLQKRLNYAITLIDRHNDFIVGTTSTGKLSIKTDKILEFFTSINDSLFAKNNTPILEYLKYTSFPNIREGLKSFKSFLTSGYTNVEEYVLRVLFRDDKHKITIPIHEFIKAIGLYNKLFYNKEVSNISNLFYPCDNNTDHFLKIRILQYLLLRNKVSESVDIYMKLSQILNDFTLYGYQENVLKMEILELINNGFIDSDEVLSDIKFETLQLEEYNLIITSKGFYYIENMINHFYYLELILEDTPIFDRESFDKIKSVYQIPNNEGKREMDFRIDTIRAFINYLDKIEKQQFSIIKEFGSIVDKIRYGVENDIRRISLALKIGNKKGRRNE